MFGLDDDAEHTVEIIAPKPGAAEGEQISIDFNECYIFQTESGSVNDDGPAEFAMRVSPFYVNDAAASSVVVTIINQTSTYATI
jgi:hypothetical protein